MLSPQQLFASRRCLNEKGCRVVRDLQTVETREYLILIKFIIKPKIKRVPITKKKYAEISIKSYRVVRRTRGR